MTLAKLCAVDMSPTPAKILAARKAAGHTQQQAAETVHRADSARWREWESGRHRMDPAVWELYLIKTGHTQSLLQPPHPPKLRVST